VRANGRLGDEQLTRDLLVREAAGDGLQHIDLTVGETGWPRPAHLSGGPRLTGRHQHSLKGPAVETAGKLQIEASPSGQLAYVTTKALATAGPVTIVMPNSSGVNHNIAIQQGVSGPVLGASPYVSKGSASVSINLKPGTYTFFCQVPGHRQAGMLGTLTAK